MLGTPSSDRIAKRREATRREILDAAWEVAREQGLGSLTLREVALRVGMRPPSLYSHFESKDAIYDAMYGQAWQEFLDLTRDRVLPAEPRAGLLEIWQTFFDFAVADLARFQLMNQRSVPGFQPSKESYAPAVEVFDRLLHHLASYGVTDEADVDLFTCLVGGLIDQQLANDPGGDRWRRQLGRVIDMYVKEVKPRRRTQ
jgi:AcrR family transcriptional regulator